MCFLSKQSYSIVLRRGWHPLEFWTILIGRSRGVLSRCKGSGCPGRPCRLLTSLIPRTDRDGQRVVTSLLHVSLSSLFLCKLCSVLVEYFVPGLSYDRMFFSSWLISSNNDDMSFVILSTVLCCASELYRSVYTAFWVKRLVFLHRFQEKLSFWNFLR